MVAPVASLGRLNLMQVSPAWAVAPAPNAPSADERPQPPAPPLPASAVALAPAAMSALIEAQEQMAAQAASLARQTTARKIDQLITRLDGNPPPARADGESFTVVRLHAAREQLT